MRVIIADDAPLLRTLFRKELTEFGIDVVAEAAGPAELLTQTRSLVPDAVVIDITYHDDGGEEQDGISAAEQLRKDYPKLGILIFSVHMKVAYLERILEIGNGYIGYLSKDRISDSHVLVDAIRRVADGGAVIDEKLLAILLSRRRSRPRLSMLTPRQRQALELLAQGFNNRAIAVRMDVVEQTVEGYLREVFHKLDIQQTPDTHKRVCAVLAWLQETRAATEHTGAEARH